MRQWVIAHRVQFIRHSALFVSLTEQVGCGVVFVYANALS